MRRLVGFVGHQPYLYDDLTALENLLFFGRMYAIKDAQQRARALLHRVGLEKRAQEVARLRDAPGRGPRHGARQRVARPGGVLRLRSEERRNVCPLIVDQGSC